MKNIPDPKRQYAALPALVLPWYAKNARALPWRSDREPYHVWVSEVMLQQTRTEAVIGYYERFLKALPDLAALAEVSEAELFKLWEGLGYYARARNLQKAAEKIVSDCGGRFPDSYAEIRALPGVGDYTAGAICSICYELPTPAVDGNVLRTLSRLTENGAPIDLPQTRREAAEALEKVYPCGQCGAFTQGLMELGACICTPKAPQCSSCPVKEICFSDRHGTSLRYPMRLPKRPRRLQERTVLILRCGDALALTRRPEKGLLAGLWQLPNLERACSVSEALTYADSLGAQPAELLREMHKTHIFTHIRWEMVGYEIRCSVKSDGFTWVNEEELQKNFALPTAFRIFLKN